MTAANSSSISDGAAALVMMRRSQAERLGVTPKAVIVGHSTYANKPGLFATAPIGAIRKLSEKTGWNLRDVDLFEINEAFAVVAMAAMRDLDLPHDKVNVHGGACALGPSDRRLGRARGGDAAGCARNVWAEARRRIAVHRRRRGDRARDRTHRIIEAHAATQSGATGFAPVARFALRGTLHARPR